MRLLSLPLELCAAAGAGARHRDLAAPRRRRAGASPWCCSAPACCLGRARRAAVGARLRQRADRRPHQVRGLAGAGAALARLRRAGGRARGRAPRALVPGAAARARGSASTRCSGAPATAASSRSPSRAATTCAVRSGTSSTTYHQVLCARRAAAILAAARAAHARPAPRAAHHAGRAGADGRRWSAATLYTAAARSSWPYDAHPVLLGAVLLLMRDALLGGGLLDPLPFPQRELLRQLPLGLVLTDRGGAVSLINGAGRARARRGAGARRSAATSRRCSRAPTPAQVEEQPLRRGGRAAGRLLVFDARPRGGPLAGLARSRFSAEPARNQSICSVEQRVPHARPSSCAAVRVVEARAQRLARRELAQPEDADAVALAAPSRSRPGSRSVSGSTPCFFRFVSWMRAKLRTITAAAAEQARRHRGVLAARALAVVLVADHHPAQALRLVVARDLRERHVALARERVGAGARPCRRRR